MGSLIIWGSIATYSGGGFYLDLPLDKEQCQLEIMKLQSNQWIDTATRIVVIEFTVYNGNVNMFGVAK